jgi:two-component system, cell cycle response regulator DivK
MTARPRSLPEALVLLHRIGGESLVRQTLQLFLESARRSLTAANKAASRGDLSEVEAAAHSLKTTAAHVGAERLERYAQELERTASHGQGVLLALADVDRSLELAMSEVRGALATLPSVDRVAVIDDSADVRLLLRMILQGHFDVSEYESGVRALEVIAETTPDLILLDISLPRMDGIETLRRIREIPGFSAIPAIALTAHAALGDATRFLSAGFQAYLAKPILDEDELLEVVRSVLFESTRSGA